MTAPIRTGEARTTTRRDFLQGGAAGLALVIASSVGIDGCPGPDMRSRVTPEDVVEGINGSWRDLVLFAGGAVVGSTLELSRGPDFDESKRIMWPVRGQALGVSRLVLVAQSAHLNGYSTEGIDPDTIGFWLPDLPNELVFAHYDPNGPFWPVHTGKGEGTTKESGQLLGEAVRLGPDDTGPRRFTVRRTIYPEGEVRPHRKDIGQSIPLSPEDAAPFLEELNRSYGGFEIRDWVGSRAGDGEFANLVDRGNFDRTNEISSELLNRVSRGLELQWMDINVFAGVLGINRTSRIFSDPRLTEESEVEWPEGQSHVVVVRPMFVVGSSEKNKKSISAEELEQVERVVSRTTIGFWLPKSNQFVYMDTGANAGNIIPVTRTGSQYREQIKQDGILGYDITLDGREMEDNSSQPYFKSGYSERVSAAECIQDPECSPSYEWRDSGKILVGHSVGFSNGVEVAVAMYEFSTKKQFELLVLAD